jgi:hypothetical protein
MKRSSSHWEHLPLTNLGKWGKLEDKVYLINLESLALSKNLALELILLGVSGFMDSLIGRRAKLDFVLGNASFGRGMPRSRAWVPISPSCGRCSCLP